MDPGSEKVVVIGAGIGGLASAIRLASAGHQVTLIESAAGPGGKMRTVPSEMGPVDAGPTVLTLRQVFDDLFAAAGERMDDHLTLLAQPLLARHWWPDGSRLDLFSDQKQTAAAIEEFAGPTEAKGFLRFYALTKALYDAFEGPVIYSAKPDLKAIINAAIRSPNLWPALIPNVSLDRFVGNYFRDSRLRQLFGRYATYVGGRPAYSPAVLGLIWQAEARGVWAVEGGMYRLALALAGLAKRCGVSLMYGTKVDRILQMGGRVSGVQLGDGRCLAVGGVVFNGDPAALTAGLLGDGPQFGLTQLATTPRSLSAQVWSFATELGGPLANELVHHNVFFSSDSRLEFGPIGAGKLPIEPTFYICAEDRAKISLPTGKERIEIVINAPALTHKNVQDPEEALHCRTKTLHLLRRRGLTFKTEPTDTALTTPYHLAQMFPASQGAIYGRSPEGTLASFQRPTARTALPGLYLAGGGCHPGAGVPMAALSGKHAAEAMMSDLASASKLGPTATLGGMSMASRMMGLGRSRL